MPRLRTLLLLIGDIAILVASYLTAFLLLRDFIFIPYSEFFDFLFIEEGLLRIVSVVVSLVACIYWFGLYESLRIRSRRILFVARPRSASVARPLRSFRAPGLLRPHTPEPGANA